LTLVSSLTIYNVLLMRIDSGLLGSTERCRVSKRCSKDTYPESYIIEYTLAYEYLKCGTSARAMTRVLSTPSQSPFFTRLCLPLWNNFSTGKYFSVSEKNRQFQTCLAHSSTRTATPRRFFFEGDSHFTTMFSGSEAGSYVRLVDSCITQLLYHS